MREIEGSQVLAPRQLRSWWAPVQAPGNHQVKHQPEIAIDADGDALADTAQFPHHASFHADDRRPNRS